MMQINECLSIEYTKKYPMSLDALPTEGVKDIKNKVQTFTSKFAGKHIEHGYIENAFGEYTATCVAGTILLYVEKQ